MDFFERQARAHRRTRVLVLLFAASVLLTFLCLYGAAAVLTVSHGPGGFWDRRWLDSPLALLVGGATALVVGLGALGKRLQFADGPAVASLLGGIPIFPDNAGTDERRLLNVVEEMAIASGAPVPQVYLLGRERGINAFAAGLRSDDVVLAVTRGAVEGLTRDELQGVIAHEFSHILNGDTRLNMRLATVVGGVAALGDLGAVLVRASASMAEGSSDDRDDRRSAAGLALGFFGAGAVLAVIGGVGVFFASLIKAAVSRNREWLADASAVQFTRNPDGICGALKKIGGLFMGSRIGSAWAREASHFYFADGLPRWLDTFATHPPLVDRIRAVDPSFDGRFADPERVAPSAQARAAVPPTPAAWLASAGAPQPAHLAEAQARLARLPPVLERAARRPDGAAGLVCALLLSDEPGIRRAQLATLERDADPAVCDEAYGLSSQLGGLDVELRLPLVELAAAALRQLSPAQYDRFAANVQALIDADGRTTLFEYTLQRWLLRQLGIFFGRVQPPPPRPDDTRPVRDDAAVLLSAAARVEAATEEAAERAFRAGVATLHATDAPAGLLPPTRCGLAQVDAALHHLAGAAPRNKRVVLAACAATTAADGRVGPKEAELLRAIAGNLDCPLPPTPGNNPAPQPE